MCYGRQVLVSENDNVTPDYITRLIHTTPADMLSWLWAWDDVTARQVTDMLYMYIYYTWAWDEFLEWTLDPPSPEGSDHGGSEFEGSARSSQQSDDDDTTTCDGCEFVGTFAQVMEHEDTCAQIIHTEDADIEDPEIETEMSEAETETDQIE